MLPESDLKLLELHKLQKLLQENNISFGVEKLYTGEQIKIPSIEAWNDEKDPKRMSIICCSGSYGYEEGLVEMWAPSVFTDPVGYLSANSALALIRKVNDDDRT